MISFTIKVFGFLMEILYIYSVKILEKIDESDFYLFIEPI